MMTSVMMKIPMTYNEINDMQFHTLKKFLDILVEMNKRSTEQAGV